MRLKGKFAQFKNDFDAIEDRWKECKKLCDGFELSIHSHHYYPLINLSKLKAEQSSTERKRREDLIKHWCTEHELELSKLIQYVEQNSIAYAKKNFSHIEWEDPFPFVSDLEEDNIVMICNELLSLSSPFVNYNIVTTVSENPIRCYLYSDKKDFETQFQEVREKKKIKNGDRVSAYVSKHIASKFCAMQFLPITDAILENLVDLQHDKKE
jgi:hypothetical protein